MGMMQNGMRLKRCLFYDHSMMSKNGLMMIKKRAMVAKNFNDQTLEKIA